MLDRPRLERRRIRLTARRWWTLAILATVAGAVVAPGTVGAQDARPAFVNGNAKAAANLFDLKVQLTGSVGGEGGLALGFGAGRALSNYQDTSSSSEGRAIDLSLMSLLNRQPTAECPDIIPIYLESTAPPVTLAENVNPANAASQLTPIRYAGFPSYGPEFGTQDATAGPGITASANTTAKLIDSGVVKMVNPRSQSTSRLVNGVREAVAVSSADSLSIMGGAMTLFRPTWTAVAKSGATTVSEASFTYSSAMILGFTRPGGNTADLKAFKGFVESTFSGLGLKLLLPEAKVVPGPNGTSAVSISPLGVGIEDMPLGSQGLRPILRALMPSIDRAIESALEVECADPALRLIADLVIGLAGGSGGLSFSLGGADATTDDIWYPPVDLDAGLGSLDSPSGDLGTTPPAGMGSLDSGTGVLNSGLGSSPASTLDSAPLTSDTLPLDEPTTTAVEVVEDDEVAAGAEVATVKRAAGSKPGNTGGTAGWVTVVVLGVVVALAAGDQLVMRRSRRKFAS